jgi:hypothetical protein
MLIRNILFLEEVPASASKMNDSFFQKNSAAKHAKETAEFLQEEMEVLKSVCD